MSGENRRVKILEILSSSSKPISATRLAQETGVTRQIIVSDVALLRASGVKIISERLGYTVPKKISDDIFKTVICKHSKDQTLDEFYAIIDNGGKVVSVTVEHSLYGQISADLNIASRYDAQEFVKKSAETDAMLLCDLTDGYHIHTIAVKNEDTYNRITDQLQSLNILISKA
ncbi:MAG: transcription repressor NadR [Clostridia bacterium]|nr:transcription repressor NadR [Clostridia bacterium]